MKGAQTDRRDHGHRREAGEVSSRLSQLAQTSVSLAAAARTGKKLPFDTTRGR